MTILEDLIMRSTRLREASKTAYLTGVRSYIQFVGVDEAHWTPESVERWRDALLQRGVKPQSVNGWLAGLRYAAKRRTDIYGASNFATMAERAMTGGVHAPEEGRALTYEEAGALVGTCDDSLAGKRDRAILLFGLKLGLRRAGIVSTKIGDYNRSTRVLSNITLKGGRLHTITLDDETADALEAWLDCRVLDPAAPLFVGFTKPQLSGLPALRSTPLSTSAVYAIVKARAATAGISDVHPHILRHTCLSWLNAEGVDTTARRSLTGIKTDAIVDRYTHRTEKTAIGAALPKIGV